MPRFISAKPYNYDHLTPTRVYVKDQTKYKTYFDGDLVNIVEEKPGHSQRLVLHYQNFKKFVDTITQVGFKEVN